MSKVILITGVNGFIGRHLALHAISNGCEVFGISRISVNDFLISKGVKDFSKEIHVPDIDAIVHLSGDPRLGNGRTFNNNFLLTQEALSVFKQIRGVNSRFIFASSISAADYPWLKKYRVLEIGEFPHPRTSYGQSKLDSEVLLEKTLDSSLWVARLGMVVGDDMRKESHLMYLFNRLKKGKFIKYFLRYSSGKLPTIHVDDCVDVLFKMAIGAIPKGKYYVFSELISISKVVSILTGIKESRFQFCLPAWISTCFPPRIASILGPVLVYDQTLVRRKLWKPAVFIENYLASWRI
jgi:nucleoside-diphosphate-sugar epimerase